VEIAVDDERCNCVDLQKEAPDRGGGKKGWAERVVAVYDSCRGRLRNEGAESALPTFASEWPMALFERSPVWRGRKDKRRNRNFKAVHAGEEKPEARGRKTWSLSGEDLPACLRRPRSEVD
jgi:hypothetical protein